MYIGKILPDMGITTNNASGYSIQTNQFMDKLKYYDEVLGNPGYKDRIKVKTEVEQLILSTPRGILLFIDCYDLSSISEIILCHVLYTSEDRKYVKRTWFPTFRPGESYMNGSTYYNYLSLYYKGIPPSECFTGLHDIWESTLIEIDLKLLYCKSLLHHKHYQLFLKLITNNMEYFKASYQSPLDQPMPNHCCDVYCTILIYYLISEYFNPPESTCIKILSYLESKDIRHVRKILSGFDLKLDHLISLTNNQIIKADTRYFEEMPTELALYKLGLFLLYFNILRNLNECSQFERFINTQCQFIVSMARRVAQTDVLCSLRWHYTLALLHILHNSNSVTDINNTQLIVSGIHTLQSSLTEIAVQSTLNDTGKWHCYCYGFMLKCRLEVSHDEKVDAKKIYTYKCFIADQSDFAIQQNNSLSSYFQYIVRFSEHSGNYKKNLINECFEGAEKILKESEIYKNIKEKGLKEIIQLFCTLKLEPATQDVWIQGLSDLLNEMFFKKRERIASIILDVNMISGESTAVHKLTKYIGELPEFHDDRSDDNNRILYRCFCAVRGVQKKHVYLDVNISKYLEHFTFIPMFDKEEEMDKITKIASFLLILGILLVSTGLNGQHKSAKLKKYLTLKYEYEDAILYLLWCSGDVEFNPGPTLKKLQKLSSSQMERKWIQEMCSATTKLLKGIPFNVKPKTLWKDKPVGWPEDQPFFDPSNKSKVHNDDNQSDEQLLNCLLDQCEKTCIKLPIYIETEITAWKEKNESHLFDLFISRLETEEIQSAMSYLMKYKDNDELKPHLKEIKLKIDFKTNPLGPACSSVGDTTIRSNTKCQSYAEIVRDLALTFCRIAKGLNPLEKSDGVWKTSPRGWKQTDLFYSPHNAGKRTEKGQDTILVDNLLAYCERNNIQIPTEIQTLVHAWKLKNKEEITRTYIVWSSLAIIEHSFKYLHLEGLLEKTNVRERLKKIGLKLDENSWRLQNPHSDIVHSINDANQTSRPKNQVLTVSCHLRSHLLSKRNQTNQQSRNESAQRLPVFKGIAHSSKSSSSPSRALQNLSENDDFAKTSSPDCKKTLPVGNRSGSQPPPSSQSCNDLTEPESPEGKKTLQVNSHRGIYHPIPTSSMACRSQNLRQEDVSTVDNQQDLSPKKNNKRKLISDTTRKPEDHKKVVVASNINNQINNRDSAEENNGSLDRIPDDLLTTYIYNLLQSDDPDETLWKDMDL